MLPFQPSKIERQFNFGLNLINSQNFESLKITYIKYGNRSRVKNWPIFSKIPILTILIKWKFSKIRQNWIFKNWKLVFVLNSTYTFNIIVWTSFGASNCQKVKNLGPKNAIFTQNLKFLLCFVNNQLKFMAPGRITSNDFGNFRVENRHLWSKSFNNWPISIKHNQKSDLESTSGILKSIKVWSNPL